MPIKIFHGRERNQELPVLEYEINNFEKELYNKGMQISSITSSVTYEGKLVVIVHYGDKTKS